MRLVGTLTLAVTFAGSDVSALGHLILFAVFDKIALFWRGDWSLPLRTAEPPWAVLAPRGGARFGGMFFRLPLDALHGLDDLQRLAAQVPAEPPLRVDGLYAVVDRAHYR